MKTIEDMRKTAHDTVEKYFADFKPKDDGTPIDDLRIEERHEKEMLPSGGVVEHGRGFMVFVEYETPQVVPVGDLRMLIRTPARVYALANQNHRSLNHLVKMLGVTPQEAADALVTQTPISIPEGETISKFTMRSTLLFNDITDEFNKPVPASNEGAPPAPTTDTPGLVPETTPPAEDPNKIITEPPPDDTKKEEAPPPPPEPPPAPPPADETAPTT